MGHAILCAKHLINDEPFAVLLPDVLVLDKKSEKNSSFVELIKAWNNTGISQVMVEEVDAKSTEKYGIVDPRVQKINTFDSISLRGLVEKSDP